MGSSGSGLCVGAFSSASFGSAAHSAASWAWCCPGCSITRCDWPAWDCRWALWADWRYTWPCSPSSACSDGRLSEAQGSSLTGWPLLLLVGLVAAIAAHFVEINAGIAIAATRTYFWVFAALLVVVGQGSVLAEPTATAVAAESVSVKARLDPRRPMTQGARGQAQRRSQPVRAVAANGLKLDERLSGLLASAAVMGVILVTLAWNYTTNPTPAASNPFSIITRSLTTLAAKGQPDTVSLAMALLVLGTWLVGLLVHVSELVTDETRGAHCGAGGYDRPDCMRWFRC